MAQHGGYVAHDLSEHCKPVNNLWRLENLENEQLWQSNLQFWMTIRLSHIANLEIAELDS